MLRLITFKFVMIIIITLDVARSVIPRLHGCGEIELIGGNIGKGVCMACEHH